MALRVQPALADLLGLTAPRVLPEILGPRVLQAVLLALREARALQVPQVPRVISALPVQQVLPVLQGLRAAQEAKAPQVLPVLLVPLRVRQVPLEALVVQALPVQPVLHPRLLGQPVPRVIWGQRVPRGRLLPLLALPALPVPRVQREPDLLGRRDRQGLREQVRISLYQTKGRY
jgi:hypothetical protein